MQTIYQQVRPAFTLLVLMTLLTGVVYPLSVTALAQTVFPRQANGSLIVRDGHAVGSDLIGQSFEDPAYFWSRPSATALFPYNAAASSGSNLAPTSVALLKRVEERVVALQTAKPAASEGVPVDLVTASGSGLDPHISVAAARYQAPRVATARGLDASTLDELITQYSTDRTLGILGEPRVNVLQLNVALDALSSGE